MLIRVIAVFTAAVLFIQPAFANGYQADLKLTTEMGEMLESLAAEAPEEADGAEEMNADDFNLDMSGSIFWTDSKIRMDMNIPLIPMPMTTIVDKATGKSYQILHEEKTIWVTDIADGTAAAEDLMMADPSEMFYNWKDIESLRDSEDVVFEELGNETMQGYLCKGYAIGFVQDESVPEPPSGDGAEGMDDFMAGFAEMLSNFSMEVWVAEELDIPVVVEFGVMGITSRMELENIRPLQGGEIVFDLPKSYKMEEFNYEEAMEMLMDEGIPVPE